jgi:hypothetical protein
MFKKITLFAVFCCAAMGVVSGEISLKRDPILNVDEFRVTRNDYTFSTVFEMAINDRLVGTAYKSSFHLMTQYDLYDSKGQYQGYGSCRFFSLGLFYTWATEIDVYDPYGYYVGMIDGQIASLEPAKFSIYDATGNRTGIAYLDKNCVAFSIVDPNNEARLLARFNRNFLQDTVDYWEVDIYEPEAISLKIIQVFAAFACDTQGKFKPDI